MKVLSAAKEDTAKVLTLLNLSKALQNSDIASAYRYSNEALQLSNKLGYDKGKFKARVNEISLLKIEGKNDTVLIRCNEYLQLALQGKDSVYIANGYLNLAEANNLDGNNEKAVSLSLKGLAIAERSKNDVLLQDAYAALQRIYFSRGEYDKAIDYGKKAIQIAKQLKDDKKVIAQSYNLAFTYNITKAFDESVALSKEVITLCRQAGDKRVESYALYNLSSVNLRTGNTREALSYGLQCLELARKNSDRGIESSSLSAIALAYLLQKQNKEAEKYVLEALALRMESDDKLGVSEVKNMMANVYFALGDPVKAYAYERESEDFTDEYNQSILSKQSAELEKKYETQKKESQIQLQQVQLKEKNILNYVLIGSAAALLFILILLYRNYRHRQKIQQQRISELETEKQLTATEAVLKGEEQERSRLAKDLHDGLGGMLSGIKYSLDNMKGNMVMTPENAQAFERSIDMLDSSIKEMRRVAHNMMPEALVKFGLDTALKDFCNDINQSGAIKINYQSLGMTGAVIEQTTAITIYRIVQELVNNTIKHASAKEAIVQLTKTNDVISITVEDDGKGFDSNILQGSKGIGWSNIQNRVEFLKGKLDVQSAPGKGTSVLIELTS